MGYRCMLCDTFYFIPTESFVCQSLDCPGEGKRGLLIDEKIIRRSNSNQNERTHRQLTIGRAPHCDIRMKESAVSQEHATISMDSSGIIKIEDLDSTNGTFVNGKEVSECFLQLGDQVLVSSFEVDWTNHFSNADKKEVSMSKSIGRNESCDIVLPWKEVSRLHATLLYSSTGNIQIRDENSANGVFVNGDRINGTISLTPGDHVLIGNKYPVDWN